MADARHADSVQVKSGDRDFYLLLKLVDGRALLPQPPIATAGASGTPNSELVQSRHHDAKGDAKMPAIAIALH